MNALPDHRRAIHGRTHSRTWRHADYDPVQHYMGRDSAAERIAIAVFVVVTGICGAALTLHFLAS